MTGIRAGENEMPKRSALRLTKRLEAEGPPPAAQLNGGPSWPTLPGAPSTP